MSPVTNLSSDVCLPVAVHYYPKVGQSSDNIKKTFLDQIQTHSNVRTCVVRTKDENMVLTKNNFLVRESYGDSCFTSVAVYEKCSFKDEHGHSHYPPVLPDVLHMLQTCKAKFSNWYLILNNECGCLSI